MANICTTTYKVTGSHKAVNNLWNTFQKMEVNSKDVWLGDLAEHYGIDYEKRQISVRGHVYYAGMADGGEKEDSLLTIETETAWSGCHALFHAINKKLKGGLSISYRETESGCGIYYVHDEGDFFTEECCVSSYGEPFDDACDDVYSTVADAISEWCDKTGIEQGERTLEEMVDFINGYEYENEDTYFYINLFEFE